MLENTFLHIPGLGPTMERDLWDRGCMTWQDALDGIQELSFGSASLDDVQRVLERSQLALANGDHQFFARALGSGQAWRAWPSFRDRCTYLDIETDGGRSGDAITMIGMFDGDNFECYLKGQNLENFRDRIYDYSMIVTFFGLGFDVPMILKRFPLLKMDMIHLDLCPTLRTIGHGGGLKKIEKELGIARSEEAEGLTGRDAITLWRQYIRNNDADALAKLINYNKEDVVNLETLAEYAYFKLRDKTMGQAPAASSSNA